MSAVLEAIAAHARRDPAAIALSGGARSYSYPDLAEAIAVTARRLSEVAPGGAAGSPVAVVLDNGPAWVILDLALIELGWPSLPIPGFFTPAQRAHALADAGAGMIIIQSFGALEIGGERFDVTPLAGDPSRTPRGTAKITYTSGSTGEPKGVCLSQAQMEAVATSLVEVLGAEYAGRHLPVLPLPVLLENVAGLYATLIAGGQYHVLSPDQLGLANPFRPDIGKLTAAIATEGATSLILVPELLRAIVLMLGFTGARLPDLSLVAVGGAKVALQLLEQAEALGLPVYEGYGLSECGSVVALNTPAAARTGSVGRPLPHLQVEVDEGREIIVRPAPFLGYTGGLASGDCVRTGDLGALDADGFLHIDGRRGNIIINAYGRNISPEWVESELLAQPEIRQALVFGEAEAELSALVVPLMPHMTAENLVTAVNRANAALPQYAQVRRIWIREPFNRDAGELTGNGRSRRGILLAHHRQTLEQNEGSLCCDIL